MLLKAIRLLLGSCCLSALLFYSACVDPCATATEPMLHIYFNSPRNYLDVYGLNGKLHIDKEEASTVWMLPMSIRDDSTTIVFESEASSDTLTLRYSRDVKLQSMRCGFRIYVDDITIGSSTTFTAIDVSSVLFDETLNVYVHD